MLAMEAVFFVNASVLTLAAMWFKHGVFGVGLSAMNLTGFLMEIQLASKIFFLPLFGDRHVIAARLKFACGEVVIKIRSKDFGQPRFAVFV